MTEWKGRGYLHITPNWTGGGYDLDDWSEHYDSGAYLGTFGTIEEALTAARQEQQHRTERRIVLLGETFAEHRA